MAVPVLEVAGHRQVGGVDNRAGVREGLGTAHGAMAVRPPEGERQAGAGGGERFEAEARQDARRASVPRVGDDESTGPAVQGLEVRGILRLGDGHVPVVDILHAPMATSTP